ncbi:MAG: sulfoxide reductase heme-binding subunit YedZ [Burkholderiaceae bacterium]|jgi:sulfoxide reductase heme-binding subunit YedZ|nr:sulfoxide reductase heme-binding subunit YedZ [Burkholderiaceae bacterium]
MRSLLLHRAAKPLVWLLCLLPFARLAWGAFSGGLGANPAEFLLRATGDWTLRLLCITLALTPLRVLTRTPALARFRRMLGLWTYFYAGLHLLCYAGFDMSLDPSQIARDIAKRPFILVGFCAFVLLTLLAATSLQRAIRLLGARRWQALHRLVYLIACLGLLHFFWMRAGKHNLAEVKVYAAVVAALLGWRVWFNLRRTRSAVGRPASRAAE